MLIFLKYFFMVSVTCTLVMVFLETAEGQRLLAAAGDRVEPYVGSEAVAWTKASEPTEGAPAPVKRMQRQTQVASAARASVPEPEPAELDYQPPIRRVRTARSS